MVDISGLGYHRSRRRSFCGHCHYCLGAFGAVPGIMRWVGKGIEAIPSDGLPAGLYGRAVYY